MRAGVNEYLYPPLEEPLRRALEKRSAERSRRRDGSAKGGGKAVAFVSAKGGCGATTLVTHVAAELGRQNLKVLLTDLDLDAGMVGFLTKTKSVYSILDAINNIHRLDISYWKALVSNGIPNVEIIASPLALATKMPPKDDQVRQVLAFAKPHYDWTLVDLGRSLSRLAMAALEETDEVCLVITLEVPALAPVQADHSNAARYGLRKGPDPPGAQPRAQAVGHLAGRIGENARRSDFCDDPERLSGAVRDLRGRADAGPKFRVGQSRSRNWPSSWPA